MESNLRSLPRNQQRLPRPSICRRAGFAALLIGVWLAFGVVDSEGAPYDPARDRAYRGWTVQSLEVRGVEADLARRIKEGLVLSGRDKYLGRERSQFYPDPLNDDIERTRLFLARRGYPDAVVTVDVTPHVKTRRLELELIVEPGPERRISEFRLEGLTPTLRRELREKGGLEVGRRFDEDLIEAAESSVQKFLAEQGYARAQVGAVLGETVAGSALQSEIVVSLKMKAGPLCTFGTVGVAGTERNDLVPLAKRVLGIEKGMLYSPTRVRNAEDRLRALGLFRQVRIEVVNAAEFDPDAPTGVLDLTCRLIDQVPRRVETGLGFRTDELFRAQARWEHRNLFQRGRGGRLSALYSQRRQNVRTGFWWPALFKANVRAELEGRVEWLFEEGFESVERGARLSFGYRPSFLTTYDLGVELLQLDVDSKSDFEELDVSNETQVELSAQWANNSVDDRLDPSRGRDSWVRAKTLIPTVLSESRFFSLEGSYSRYFGLTKNTVFAMRGRAGWARPWGEISDLASNNRFFAGGSTSMRGFRRSRLGPVDPEGTPLGGEAKLETGFELRVPIWKTFRGAVFLDAGQVWSNRHQVRLDELEYAVGPALIISTPIGPIRGDVGFRLTDLVPDQPKTAYHIAIGHPF